MCISQLIFPSAVPEFRRWTGVINIIHPIIFFSLIGPGTVRNVLMFATLGYTSALGTEKRPVDLILIHLAFSNMIIICITGLKELATVFYFRNFLGDIACKTIVYLEMVAHGLSMTSAPPGSSVWSRLSPSVPGPHCGESSIHGMFLPFSSSFGS